MRTLVFLAPLAALAACATPNGAAGPARPSAAAAASTPQVRAVSPDEASPYGLFLAGRGAMNDGRSADAAGYFGAAAKAVGDESFLTDRAFSAALLAGDIRRSAALAPTGPGADPAVMRLGVLVRGVETLAEGDGKGARTILTSTDVGYPHKTAVALIVPFAAAAAGDVQGSIVHLVLPGEPIAQFFAALDQAKLQERAKKFDEAETGYKALIAAGDPGAMASLNYGAMLERRGRRADAAAVYQAALLRNPDNDELRDGRLRALGHKPAPRMPTIQQDAAEALIAPAASLMIQHQQEVALAYLRLALRLDPQRDEAWMLVGDILAQEGDKDGAREAYLKVAPGDSRFVTARGKLAWTYQNAGDKETALKLARETLAAQPDSLDAQVNLADLLRADERYDESAQVLDKVIAGAGPTPDWRLYYARAMSLQQAGHWPEAERDLQAALKQRPDEPELLNFLAYSWVDRGEHLNEALAMTQKAVSLNPQSGAMIDSLGWAYYRLGDYKTAVTKLEQAVVLEPSDPDVNDHLGDAYWRVGRKTEAEYQWKRVLTLEPTAKLKTAVEQKLKSGLDTPAAPAVVAGS
ncbi:MAG TPA: tetratricopeptide repeat protein [Caulobacteraceae bacterium]|nr:tetratricopeptide repeat protein [Caulobacteraceae bacterium]